MSEQDDRGIRRVTRKDRKRKIDTRGPLFPPEEDLPPLEEPSSQEPETSTEAQPSGPLPGLINEPPAPQPTTRPAAERFPPLAFTSPERQGEQSAAPAKPPRRSPTRLYNLIALIFFVATIVLLVVFVIISINPQTPLNPFPPFTPLPIIVTTTPLPPTATLPPTMTLSPTPGPTATFTPLPPGG